MKTPEEMAEEHAKLRCPEQGPEFIVWCMCRGDFLAGYQAAKDQLADADKVIRLVWEQVWRVVPPSTDSGRTPPFNETVLGYTRDGRLVLAQHCWDGWTVEGDGIERPMSHITHYMPLPEPPKENK